MSRAPARPWRLAAPPLPSLVRAGSSWGSDGRILPEPVRQIEVDRWPCRRSLPAPKTIRSGTKTSSPGASWPRWRASSGLHGHPAARLRHLGEDAGGPRSTLQVDRSQERGLPAAHPDELHQQGSRARRGVRSRAGRRHARRRQEARRGVRHPADVGDDHRSLLLQVDRLASRPAPADQPVGAT